MLDSIRTQIALAKRFAQALPLLFSVRKDPELQPILRSYLGWIPLCVFSQTRHWCSLLVSTRRRFARDDQRPTAFYGPHLPAVRFPEPDETARRLASQVDVIQSEFASVGRSIESPSKALVNRGDWNTFPLVRASVPFPDNIARCPRTWAVVETCPRPPEGVRGGVYFSILDPGTRITLHCGPSNLKYRYHLSIEAADGARIRSGSEWRQWKPGDCLVPDDSFEHEVVHEGGKRRVVLIVDCWHPALNEREREFLTALHRRFSRSTGGHR